MYKDEAMDNRCDSVDALMYAYYAFMKRKEENQMLEKDKDYIEMRVSSTDCAFTQNAATQITVDGYVYTTYMNIPDPGELYILISKEKFNQLQAENEHYRELAKQFEHNYGLLLSMTGFNDLEDLTNYIHDAGKDFKGDWKTIKEIADIAEEDYISERDKAEALQTENKQLKKKLEEFSPVPRYREFLKALYPEATEATIEKLVWTTGQLCCGRDLPNALQTDLEYYRAISSAQAKYIGCWQEATGCSTPEEAKELIDGKKKRIIELRGELDNSLSANEELKKKLAVPDPFAEYKELFEKLHSKEDIEKFEWTLNHICGGRASANGWMVTAKLWRRNYETLSKLVGFSSVEEIRDYLTNEAECDTLQEAVSKLKDQVKYTCDEWYSANSRNNSWKAAAECNSPKELIEKLNLLRDDISGRSTVIEHHKRTIEEWQKVTGCLRPEDISTESMISKSMANEITAVNEELWSENEKCEKRIEALLSEIREWKNVTGFSTPEDYEGGWAKIRCLCEGIYKSNGDYDNLLKLTGYKSEDHIHVLLQDGERQRYQTMRDFINYLKKNADFIESNWQAATGCKYPAEASKKLKYYENRLDSAKESASYAIRHLDNIVFRDDKRTDWSDK